MKVSINEPIAKHPTAVKEKPMALYALKRLFRLVVFKVIKKQSVPSRNTPIPIAAEYKKP